MRTFREFVFDLSRLEPEDLPVARAFLREMRRILERRNVEETPLLHLRQQDVLANYLAVRRLERLYSMPEPGVCETDCGHEDVSPETIGRARERLRRAMKALEEYVVMTGTPANVGLADEVLPLLKKTRGVLEDALAHEALTKRDAQEEEN
jgi:hypothetical protein